MLSVIMMNVVYAECHKYGPCVECFYAECGGAIAGVHPSRTL
jgi:hypothetical protein